MSGLGTRYCFRLGCLYLSKAFHMRKYWTNTLRSEDDLRQLCRNSRPDIKKNGILHKPRGTPPDLGPDGPLRTLSSSDWSNPDTWSFNLPARPTGFEQGAITGGVETVCEKGAKPGRL